MPRPEYREINKDSSVARDGCLEVGEVSGCSPKAFGKLGEFHCRLNLLEQPHDYFPSLEI